MPEKHIKDIDSVVSYAVILSGLWGAFMNYFKRKTSGYTKLKKLSLFAFDLISSAGIAIMTYLIIRGYGANELLAVGLSGWFGHQGTRAFYTMETIITSIIEQKLNVKLKNK